MFFLLIGGVVIGVRQDYTKLTRTHLAEVVFDNRSYRIGEDSPNCDRFSTGQIEISSEAHSLQTDQLDLSSSGRGADSDSFA